MDLLAENILKQKVENDAFAWLDGQRQKVIEAMQDYYAKKYSTYADTVCAIIEQNIKLKEFVSQHEPRSMDYKKTREDSARFKRDHEEWEKLMQL